MPTIERVCPLAEAQEHRNRYWAWNVASSSDHWTGEVSSDDYLDLPLQLPDAAKVNTVTINWQQVGGTPGMRAEFVWIDNRGYVTTISDLTISVVNQWISEQMSVGHQLENEKNYYAIRISGPPSSTICKVRGIAVEYNHPDPNALPGW
jgi:hypothetical protein